MPRKTFPDYKRYEVTSTPAIVTYAGSHTYGEDTVEVWAPTAAAAIAAVRKQYRDQEGRYAVKCSYRAKLVEDC